jgi:hypothetical protein
MQLEGKRILITGGGSGIGLIGAAEAEMRSVEDVRRPRAACCSCPPRLR